MSFANLAREACDKNALAYVAADLYKDLNNKKIKKIDITKFLTVDFIKETIGTELELNPTIEPNMTHFKILQKP